MKRLSRLPSLRAPAIGCGTESITSRATAPFWRASTKRPGTSIVRMTAGAAATLISVTIVVLASGATVGAIGRPTVISVGGALGRDHQHAVAAQQQAVVVAGERERPGHGPGGARSPAACGR